MCQAQCQAFQYFHIWIPLIFSNFWYVIYAGRSYKARYLKCINPKRTHICHAQQWPTNTKYSIFAGLSIIALIPTLMKCRLFWRNVGVLRFTGLLFGGLLHKVGLRWKKYVSSHNRSKLFWLKVHESPLAYAGCPWMKWAQKGPFSLPIWYPVYSRTDCLCQQELIWSSNMYSWKSLGNFRSTSNQKFFFCLWAPVMSNYLTYTLYQ